jgi:hypothetical protein
MSSIEQISHKQTRSHITRSQKKLPAHTLCRTQNNQNTRLIDFFSRKTRTAQNASHERRSGEEWTVVFDGGRRSEFTSGSPNKAGFLLKSAYQGMTLDGVE